MKTPNLFQEIFRLAVRLAGLFFLCVGLKDLVVQTFMALAQAHGTSLINLLTNFLPVGFTLTVALWLLRGNGLIRLAYPENAGRPDAQARHASGESGESGEPVVPAPASAQSLSQLEQAERKLSALVAKTEAAPPADSVSR